MKAENSTMASIYSMVVKSDENTIRALAHEVVKMLSDRNLSFKTDSRYDTSPANCIAQPTVIAISA